LRALAEDDMEAPHINLVSGAPAKTVRRVMLVDDDVMCLGAIEEIVARWGYDVVSFFSFTEARAYLAKETPDVAIVDVRLGDYNGLQLLQMLRLAHPETLLAAASGYDDPVLRAEASQMGALYLTKPIDCGRLRQWLDGAAAADSSVVA
jgi:two-component system response regulator RegA